MAIETNRPVLEVICSEKEDLEFLMQELDSLITRRYLSGVYGTRSPHKIAGGAFLPPAEDVFSELCREALRVLEDLRKEVFLHYRSIDDPEQTVILENPIQGVKTDGNPVVVFTTNYDPAVEDYCQRRRMRLIRRIHVRSGDQRVGLGSTNVRFIC